MPYLIVIYGPPFAGKTSIAAELARSLPDKTALLSIDAMLREAIAIRDPDADAELEMVHTQVRLLTANFLKNRYHVVLEAPFYHERDGRLLRFEQELDQLPALMRNLAQAVLLVRLNASPEALRRRAETAGRGGEAESATRIAAAYKGRYGLQSMTIDTEQTDAAGASDLIREKLPLG